MIDMEQAASDVSSEYLEDPRTRSTTALEKVPQVEITLVAVTCSTTALEKVSQPEFCRIAESSASGEGGPESTRRWRESNQASDPFDFFSIVSRQTAGRKTSAWKSSIHDNGTAAASLADVPGAAHFLSGICRLASRGEIRMAVDVVVDYVDRLLNEGRFENCRELLKQADPEQLVPELIVALLGITLAAKPVLHPSRAQFSASAGAALKKKLGTERAERLWKRYS